MNVEQKTGQYKNQKLNKKATICSVTLTPGLWLITGFVDCDTSHDLVYNNGILGQVIRSSAIGGGGSMNVMLRGISTTTEVDLYTYDYSSITFDITYRGILTAICLKPYSI